MTKRNSAIGPGIKRGGVCGRSALHCGLRGYVEPSNSC